MSNCGGKGTWASSRFVDVLCGVRDAVVGGKRKGKKNCRRTRSRNGLDLTNGSFSQINIRRFAFRGEKDLIPNIRERKSLRHLRIVREGAETKKKVQKTNARGGEGCGGQNSPRGLACRPCEAELEKTPDTPQYTQNEMRGGEENKTR